MIENFITSIRVIYTTIITLGLTLKKLRKPFLENKNNKKTRLNERQMGDSSVEKKIK